MPRPQTPTGYQRPLTAYAEAYGAGLRSVKRWVAVGRAKEDPPPLDRPAEMPGWWSRHYKQQVPDKILSASVGKMARATRAGGESAVRLLPPPSIPLVIDRDELSQAEREVAKAASEIEKLRHDIEANPGEIALATKIHAQALANRKAIESTLHDRKVREATFVERSTANQIAGEWVSSMEKAIRSLFLDWCQRTRTQHTAEAEEAWQACVDATFERFHQEVFPAA